MKAEEFVKQHYPKATIERQKENGPIGQYYFLVRPSRMSMWIGEGSTKSKAWKDAKKYIVNLLQNE